MSIRRSALATAAVVAAITLAGCGGGASSGSGSASSTAAPLGSTSAASTAASTAASSTAGSAGTSSAPSGSDVAGGLAADAGAGRKIVYVPGLTGVPFYSSVSCGAAAAAAAVGAEFTTQGDPTFAVDKQTAIINALVASQPDAILISITDPEAMITPLQEAKDAGIKIIGVDGDLTDESVMDTNIQSDNIKGGALAADQLGEAMGGQGEVIIIDNATGSLISGARVKGFSDQLAAKYPDIKNLGVQYSANSADKAAGIASAAATSNPNLKGIFTAETNNTQGAVTGIQEAGKTGEVKLVGYDTSDPIVEALRAGAVDGLVVQFPYGEGQLGVQSAIRLLNGEEVPRQQETPFVMATPENVDTPEVQQYIYKVNC